MSTSNPLDALNATPNNLGGRPPQAGNPLDLLGAETSTAPALPAPVASAPIASENPLDTLMRPQASAAPASVSTPQSPSNPLDSINPLDRLNPTVSTLGRVVSPEEAHYADNTAPDKMEDEPWYSKAWDWANSPLYDLHKWGTREGAGTFERGLETGLEDIGSGFLTPLQLGLTIATFGGSAAESAGLGAIRALGVSEKAAPIVVRGLKGLMTAGFSLDMLHGLVTQSPQFLDALKDGDTETATRLGTNLLATGVFLREGLKHGIEDAEAVKKYINGKSANTTEQLKLAADLAGDYDLAKSMGTDKARTKMEEIQQQIEDAGIANDSTRQAGIRHYMNADGDTDKITKLIGIADGTIKPREYTPEEKAEIEKQVVVNNWANESKGSVKNADGSPKVLYLADSADGTHKMGQALAEVQPEAGSDPHFVQLKNPIEMRAEANLTRYIEDAGGEAEAKEKLQKAGYDGIVYGEGADKRYITFDDNQYREIEPIKKDAAQPWNREHVYVAVDKKYHNQVLNAGIKNARRGEIQYYATPGEALSKATLPDSGNPKDLEVYAVPRAEVENSVEKYNAQKEERAPAQYAWRSRDIGEEGVPSESHSQATMGRDEAERYLTSRGRITGNPQELVRINLDKLDKGDYTLAKGPNGHDWVKFNRPLTEEEVLPAHTPDSALVTNESHMPGHQLELDENGKFTGRSTPLRPLGAEDLPGDNSRFNSSYTEDEKKKYLDGMRAALNLTDAEKNIATTLRQLYDESFNHAHKNGLIRQWVEAYHPQAWADDPNGMWHWLFNKNPETVDNETLNQLRHDTNSGHFDTNINQARHRAYSTEFEGIMAGQKFKTDDLSMHAFNHMNAIEHAIASREYLDRLRAKGATAQDGRPAVVMQGTTRVMGAQTNNPAIAIEPNAVRPIHISPEKVEDMQILNPKTNSTPLEDGLKNGTIKKLPWTVDVERDGKMVKQPAYAYTDEGYESIDHPAMRGWGFSGVDTDGNPAIMHGNLVVHPDFADHVRQVMGVERSPIRESAMLRGIAAASGEAKGLLLSISPFHIVQEGLRAAMMGINPFKFDRIDINDNPTLQALTKGGLTRNEFKARDQFSSGYASHSKLISKIPGLNRFQSAMQDFLFEKYIPGLKDRAAIKMYDDIRNAHPELSQKEAASRVADTVNDVFGGQNWRKLGVSAAQQDFMRMVALAPDWLVSEMRMTGRALGVIGEDATNSYARKAMAKQLGAIWLGARVLNMLVSGQMHNEAPFGVVHKNDKGEETVYSVRTLPTDIMHALSDPEEFVRGRVNPLTVRPTIEFLSGRDAMGRRAPAETQVKDTIQNIVPIAGQGLFKNNPLSTPEQVAKAAGATVMKYRTEAEKLAQQYASDRMPSGPVNKDNLRAHQEDIRLEDALRKGQVSKGEILQHVSKRRADEIIRRAPMTPLQARFDRLPLSDAINVWDAATKTEKDELKSMLWHKRVEYIKQHTAAERADDPTWIKLQSAYADLR